MISVKALMVVVVVWWPWSWSWSWRPLLLFLRELFSFPMAASAFKVVCFVGQGCIGAGVVSHVREVLQPGEGIGTEGSGYSTPTGGLSSELNKCSKVTKIPICEL